MILDDSEYMVRLAFIANENLKDLRFTSIYLSDDGIVDGIKETINLRDYLIKFEEALMKDDDSYLEYIDLDSFAKWLLVMDYL